MDFRHQLTTVAGVASVNADALLVVVVGNKAPSDLPAALAKALHASLEQGDLALETGRCLYVGHLAGVKAPRVAFAVAADGSPRAVKSALSMGLAQLKGLGGKHLAVWLSGAASLDRGARRSAGRCLRRRRLRVSPHQAQRRARQQAGPDHVAVQERR